MSGPNYAWKCPPGTPDPDAVRLYRNNKPIGYAVGRSWGTWAYPGGKHVYEEGRCKTHAEARAACEAAARRLWEDGDEHDG